MLPVGTRVRVNAVGHLARDGKPPRRLVGRTAIVADHENGMNIVTGLTAAEHFTGHYVFADTDLTAIGTGPAPAMPPVYRVRGYWLATGGAR